MCDLLGLGGWRLLLLRCPLRRLRRFGGFYLATASNLKFFAVDELQRSSICLLQKRAALVRMLPHSNRRRPVMIVYAVEIVFCKPRAECFIRIVLLTSLIKMHAKAVVRLRPLGRAPLYFFEIVFDLLGQAHKLDRLPCS